LIVPIAVAADTILPVSVIAASVNEKAPSLTAGSGIFEEMVEPPQLNPVNTLFSIVNCISMSECPGELFTPACRIGWASA